MKYIVQFLRVVEVVVDADDELQAEVEAYKEAGTGSEIAMFVAEDGDKHASGALGDECNITNFSFAKSKFWSVDKEWVEGG